MLKRKVNNTKSTLSFLFFLFLIFKIEAQQNATPVRDAFLNIASDARAAGQGDIGVATSSDVFSQLWNPAKHIFSSKKSEIGVTQIMTNSNDFDSYAQLNLNFYNKLDDRNAYALSIRNYTTSVSQFIDFGTDYQTHEVAIEGSYALRLADEFAMSVGGRFISLKGKFPLQASFNEDTDISLYGIDIAGYYSGNEKAYNKYNGRWRAGFNFSNLRGNSLYDNTDVEIYAPSMLKVGIGFDFIFNHDNLLALTSEYKRLLNDYTENDQREKLEYGIEGTVAAIGIEYVYKEKIVLRSGYSHGIKRVTDSFASLGGGFRADYAAIDLGFLIGLTDYENIVRKRLRISISLNLDEIFSD